MYCTLDILHVYIYTYRERRDSGWWTAHVCVCVCVIFIVVTKVCRVHSYTCSLKQQEVQKLEETETENTEGFPKSKNHITCLLGHTSGTSLLNAG